MQAVGRHDLGADQVGDRADGAGGLAAPVDECRAGDVGAHSGEDLALPVERNVIVELRDQDMRQERRPGQAARDRPGRRRGLHHALAVAAGLLRPVDLDHLQLGGDEVEDLGHVLADQPQHAAAIGAALAGVEGDDLARRVGEIRGLPRRRGGSAALPPHRRRLVIGRLVALRRRIGGRTGHLEPLEGELQLRDLAVDLLRARPVSLPLQPAMVSFSAWISAS
jgi:hypothetical protein